MSFYNVLHNMTFGFILTRYVHSVVTNKYWNECIKCIRRFYTEKIIVIDDNSNQEYVQADFEYDNVEIVQSEFPQRGELLPYFYFHKYHYFDNAIILHDSVFIQKKINFNKLENMGMNVIPLWHFDKCKGENINNTRRIANYLSNNQNILIKIQNSTPFTSLQLNVNNTNHDWYGCFGCQSFINYNFLTYLQNKYKLFNLLHVVKKREDRCSLERIMGILFYIEYPKICSQSSIFGSIFNYGIWGYTYHSYCNDKQMNKITLPAIKVFSGR
jgi:hypothetical protein